MKQPCFVFGSLSSRVEKSKSWTSRPLKMGSIGCLETSVQTYHCTLRNIAEEGGSHGKCFVAFGQKSSLTYMLECRHVIDRGSYKFHIIISL